MLCTCASTRCTDILWLFSWTTLTRLRPTIPRMNSRRGRQTLSRLRCPLQPAPSAHRCDHHNVQKVYASPTLVHAKHGLLRNLGMILSHWTWPIGFCCDNFDDCIASDCVTILFPEAQSSVCSNKFWVEKRQPISPQQMKLPLSMMLKLWSDELHRRPAQQEDTPQLHSQMNGPRVSKCKKGP